jgi:hypothetical protein
MMFYGHDRVLEKRSIRRDARDDGYAFACLQLPDHPLISDTAFEASVAERPGHLR